MDRFDRVHRWLLSLWRRYGWGWALAAALGLAFLVWLWIILF